MKISLNAVVSEVYVSPEKGTQSLTLCDTENGGIVKISMGVNHAEVRPGMTVKGELQVKARTDKVGGNYLMFEGGSFGAPKAA